MKRNLRIFIGSSSFYAPKKPDDSPEIDREQRIEDLCGDSECLLAPVFNGLIAAGFVPCPWWKEEVWTDAKSFYTSLITASKEHDGGIFIFGPDDPIGTSSNESEAEKHRTAYVTRDNVIFEFGMFLAAKGKQRMSFSNLACFWRQKESNGRSRFLTDHRSKARHN